jgi:hypothetical protein
VEEGAVQSVWRVGAMVLVALTLTACGGDGGDGTTAEGGSPDINGPEVAEQAVRDYYTAIDGRDFGRARQFLGPQQRREDDGYRTWKSG